MLLFYLWHFGIDEWIEKYKKAHKDDQYKTNEKMQPTVCQHNRLDATDGIRNDHEFKHLKNAN